MIAAASRPLVIVQSSPLKQTAFDLAKAARQRGFAVQDISFDRDEPQAPRLAGHYPVFLFGSVALLDAWRRQYPEMARWVWWDEEALSPVAWVRGLGDRFLNSTGFATTVGAFKREDGDGPWHIRPLRNDKRPPGKLYDRAEFKALDLQADLAIWVAPPAAIQSEVRVWFVGGHPVEASQYRRSGERVNLVGTETTRNALKVAGELGTRYLPHPHCVMDLAEMVDGSWKIIEFNPIQGAGWYAADPGVVLAAFVACYPSQERA